MTKTARGFSVHKFKDADGDGLTFDENFGCKMFEQNDK